MADSLAAGLVAAALLVAAPFIPPTEAGVTGAVLCGLALGWAMLAVLRALGDLYARYQRLGQRGPAPNSLASRDGRAELGQYAWVLGASAMSSAIDHLISWNELRQRVHPTAT